MRGRVRTHIAICLAALAALAFAVPASAQTQVTTQPGQTVYSPPSSGEVKGTIGGGGPSDVVTPPSGAPADQGGGGAPTTPVNVERGAAPTPSASGSLPFTGFEAGLVALAGLALLGTGFAMRRAARQPV